MQLLILIKMSRLAEWMKKVKTVALYFSLYWKKEYSKIVKFHQRESFLGIFYLMILFNPDS